jgi:hypothetical protein
MSHSARIRPPVLVSLTLACLAGAWWGCSKQPEQQATGTSHGASASSGSGGAGSTGGTGGMADLDGGGDGGVCVSTSAPAEYVPLDIVFLIDQSGSMNTCPTPSACGPNGKFPTITSAVTAFCSDPASAGIGAGVLFFPYSPWDCVLLHYETLTVPIGVLPANASAITNAVPTQALGYGTPTYPALQGALMQATAHQDANPTHKVIVVLATDSEPNGCDESISDIAGLATSALNYNGVLTYVIGVLGATIADLDAIAAAGGTTQAFDDTNDATQVSANIDQIRTQEVGCNFQIPAPPNEKPLDPDEVNFSYDPMGMGTPVILPRAENLAGCNSQPGWYYNSNTAPTQIILCPASCNTVQADSMAKVSVLFGCKSQFE